MQLFRNVLVHVDLKRDRGQPRGAFVPQEQVAIQRSIWLARHTGAELTFVCVLDFSEHIRHLEESDHARVTQTVESAAHQVLTEVTDWAKRKGVVAQSKLLIGKESVEIIREVLRARHDLVISGSGNMGAVDRLFLGSTAMKLLRRCPCPVWLTKLSTPPETINILVASDLSDVSGDALSLAVGLGRLIDAHIHLLHAVDFPLDRWNSTGLSDETTERYHRAVRAEAEKSLYQQLQQTDYRTLPHGVQVHIVDELLPEVAILDFIEKNNIHMLIMGTVARAGIPGMVMGNHAERLLPLVPCSILAIKPADFLISYLR